MSTAEYSELLVGVLIQLRVIAEQGGMANKKQLARVYSDTCWICWTIQDSDNEFHPSYQQWGASLEDQILVIAAMLEREPPEWLMCQPPPEFMGH